MLKIWETWFRYLITHPFDVCHNALNRPKIWLVAPRRIHFKPKTHPTKALDLQKTPWCVRQSLGCGIWSGLGSFECCFVFRPSNDNKTRLRECRWGWNETKKTLCFSTFGSSASFLAVQTYGNLARHKSVPNLNFRALVRNGVYKTQEAIIGNLPLIWKKPHVYHIEFFRDVVSGSFLTDSVEPSTKESVKPEV